ncbi:MAG: diguanylate cyclase response regulator [Candidatus Tectimicrobiota bacterium]|nr:MAG: diguanylate cyclase response regulator [Candidatus Tectomicrobia bacterium]
MKVLIAEDDPVSRRLLEATLRRWGYEVIACADGTTAWQILQQADAPQLVILDWMMPGMDGIQVCRAVRTRAAEPYVYILLLTARSQKSDIITGLEAGADDYLTKPFDTNELRMRLRAGRRILDLQAELIFAREALREQAMRDSLTRLWNRAAILSMLRQELERARRTQAPLSVVLADLDHFKKINDTYGHLAGDMALREAARRMRAAVRPYDAIGRYGGEEFLLVLPGCDAAAALALAQRLREAIAAEPLLLTEGKLALTLSLGVASRHPQADDTALIAAADAALYRAKRHGRNRVEVATLADFATAVPDVTLSPSFS